MNDFSPASFTINELVNPLALALIAALILTVGVWIVSVFTSVGEDRWLHVLFYYAGAATPVSLIGYATGFLSGINRSSVVGTVLPAVLALIGGINIYAFSGDSKFKLIIAYCVCVLVVSLFYGIENGSYQRDLHREDRLKAMFEMEHRLIHYRKNRDLPVQSSDWLLLGESAGK